MLDGQIQNEDLMSLKDERLTIIKVIQDSIKKLSKLSEHQKDATVGTFIPHDATVLRIYENQDGTREIMFENGNPSDYLWSSWEKSNWKSIAWLMGKDSKAAV